MTLRDKRRTFPVSLQTHEKISRLKEVSGLPLHVLVERALDYAYIYYEHWKER